MANGTTTSTTEQITRQAPFLEDYVRRLLGSAFGTEDAPGLQPIDIPQTQVAGFQPLQQEALTRGVEGLGVYQPFLESGARTLGTGAQAAGAGIAPILGGTRTLSDAATRALGSAQQFAPEGISAFMDPYQREATDVGLRELGRQGELGLRDIAGSAVRGGAFGGTRFGLAEAEQRRNTLEAQRRLLQTDLSRNYTQALGASQSAFENQQRRQQGLAQLLGQIGTGQGQLGGQLGNIGTGIGQLGVQQAGLGQLAQQLGQQDVNVLSQLGGQQQAVQQNVLDALRTTSLQRQGEPYQRFGTLSDILRGVPTGQSTFQVATAPRPSPLSTILGAGATLAGIGGSLGWSPFGNRSMTAGTPRA
jgi:hypothetical protein